MTRETSPEVPGLNEDQAVPDASGFRTELEYVQELLRRVLMDYGRCDHLESCACSAGQAHRYLDPDEPPFDYPGFGLVAHTESANA